MGQRLWDDPEKFEASARLPHGHPLGGTPRCYGFTFLNRLAVGEGLDAYHLNTLQTSRSFWELYSANWVKALLSMTGDCNIKSCHFRIDVVLNLSSGTLEFLKNWFCHDLPSLTSLTAEQKVWTWKTCCFFMFEVFMTRDMFDSVLGGPAGIPPPPPTIATAAGTTLSLALTLSLTNINQHGWTHQH